ncbi:4-coumarate--CoA ligase-like 10 [Acorus gramineus]|uniref:4-coumarate--CoA ligase n=1 Tax=Acorus gramineus TaxID=55184 RepID=A0AAV9AJY9_ACOGR|nr:4-coumarate--CoA ligase-like 10 [Acorus gramineus]
MEAQSLTETLTMSAAQFPSRRALSISGRFDLTYSRLHELVEEAAHLLISHGVRHGDVIALTFPNTVEFVITLMAVIRARGVAAPLNSAYTAEEFDFYLSDSDSTLLNTSDSDEGNGPAQAAAAKLGIPHATVSLSNPSLPISLYLPARLSGPVDPGPVHHNEPSDVALFLHTAGTTSRPKGVPLTQLNLAASVNNIRSVYRLAASDSSVLVHPLFHVHGLVAGLLSTLSAGSAVTLPSSGRFSASSFWPDMLAYTATCCCASLEPATLYQMEKAFGAPVLEAYAMTEAAHQMSSNPLPEDGPNKAGSVGQEIVVLDERGSQPLPLVPGEIWRISEIGLSYPMTC